MLVQASLGERGLLLQTFTMARVFEAEDVFVIRLGLHVQEDKDARGYTAMFHLDRELTDTLLTGYSAVARRKVIARWHELETRVQQPLSLDDPAALRAALLGYTEKVHALETTGLNPECSRVRLPVPGVPGELSSQTDRRQ